MLWLMPTSQVFIMISRWLNALAQVGRLATVLRRRARYTIFGTALIGIFIVLDASLCTPEVNVLSHKLIARNDCSLIKSFIASSTSNEETSDEEEAPERKEE